MKYVVYSEDQIEAACEEMSSVMFHGGFMTRRALGEPAFSFESSHLPGGAFRIWLRRKLRK